METRALRDGVPRHDFAPVRWGHLRSASPADPYRARGKPRGPASCPDCRAVFARGRWTWLARRLGEAVHRAHQGALTVQYNAEQRQVRVRWES